MKCYIDKHIFSTQFFCSEDRVAFITKAEYSYIVDGEQFTGNTICFSSEVYDRDYDTRWSKEEEERLKRCNEAQQMIYNKLKTASRVIVHYHPANPSDAVLAVGFDGNIAERIKIVE